MTLDRTGEPADNDDPDPWHDPRCRNGWLGYDDEHRPIPCLQCRDHLRAGTVRTNDCSTGYPSARAQAAIEKAERDER